MNLKRMKTTDFNYRFECFEIHIHVSRGLTVTRSQPITKKLKTT